MSAIVIKTVEEMQKFSSIARLSGEKIGLVPTMGFLHDGHLSLVKKSKSLADVTIVSIFVNPTQFAPTEDLEKYPRDFKRDEELLNDAGVDAIFYPSVEEIYPKGFQTYVEVNEITKELEGEKRPAHFKGVTTIVNMLFNIVKPDFAVFGQKDAQQVAVIKQMTRDMRMGIDILVQPITREEDGLAMSSRNIYLNEKERKDALVLSRSLDKARKMIDEGEREVKKIITKIKSVLDSVDTSDKDYVAVVNAVSFKAVKKLEEKNEYYILIACKIGKTRLIDNLLVKL